MVLSPAGKRTISAGAPVCSDHNCRLRGSSLIETLVALGIVVVGLNLLAQLVVNGIEHSFLAESRARAALLAQAKMEEIVAARDRLPAWKATARETYSPAEVEGAFRFADPSLARYCWTWDIADSKDHPGLTKITVSVMWRRRSAKVWTSLPPLRTLVFAGAEADSPATITALRGKAP